MKTRQQIALLYPVQRHPGLQGLSREHHFALVFARTLRETADAWAVQTAQQREGTLAKLRATWAEHISPHFAIEERELLPLSLGRGPEVAACAATVKADHTDLRMLIQALSSASSVTDAEALAQRLEGHIRFEERHWFPALEAALDPAILEQLTWRLELEPRVPIVSFHHDDGDAAGVWIAELACGHSQHVRHNPPFQNTPWVTSEDGRRAKMGERLKCVLCRMPRLPPNVQMYKETPVFDSTSVPQGLLASHTLRPDTWGQIVVIEGKVDYAIESDPPLAFVLRPGVDGTVAPEQPHHVQLQTGAQFKVRFLR